MPRFADPAPTSRDPASAGARDRELGRPVAFKAVRAGGQAGAREERVLREAEAAARLSHLDIVTLPDLGRSERGPYLVLRVKS